MTANCISTSCKFPAVLASNVDMLNSWSVNVLNKSDDGYLIAAKYWLVIGVTIGVQYFTRCRVPT